MPKHKVFSSVPGSPGWTQQLIRESNEGPQLELIVRPLIEGAVVRKGFSIRVHQDNTLWTSLQRNGRKPCTFKLPPWSPLYLGGIP